MSPAPVIVRFSNGAPDITVNDTSPDAAPRGMAIRFGRSPGPTKLNDAAMLVGTIPIDPRQWNAITSRANRRAATFSTFFGNDIAVRYSRSNAGQHYPAGSVIALVTWHQQEDSRWFGGQLPAAARSVEFVFVEFREPNRPSVSYEIYEGSPLKKIKPVDDRINSRGAFLLSQRAAVLP